MPTNFIFTINNEQLEMTPMVWILELGLLITEFSVDVLHGIKFLMGVQKQHSQFYLPMKFHIIIITMLCQYFYSQQLYFMNYLW